MTLPLTDSVKQSARDRLDKKKNHPPIATIAVVLVTVLSLLLLRSLNSTTKAPHAGKSLPVLRVPVIDIAPLLQRAPAGSSKAALALLEKQQQVVGEAIRHVAQKYGIFRIKGHGFTPQQTTATAAAMNGLFGDVPKAEKQRMHIAGQGFTRGFIGVGSESGSQRFEVKEGFSYGYDWPEGKKATNSLQGPNRFPSPEQGLAVQHKQTLHQLYTSMIHISEAIIDGFSLAMGKQIDYLRAFCQEGDTISLMRLFHYFPYHSHAAPDSAAGAQRIGSSPHTDWGFLTLILEPDNVPGLEVFFLNEWYTIPAVPDTFIVNCGDYFALMTGGLFKSPLHRVEIAEQERMSAVLFYYPSYDSKIPKQTEFVEQQYSLLTDQTQQYKPIPAMYIEGGEEVGIGDCAEIEDVAFKREVAAKEKEFADTSFGDYIVEKWSSVYRS